MPDNRDGSGVGVWKPLTAVTATGAVLAEIDNAPTATIIQIVLQFGAIGLLAYWIIFDSPKQRAELREERATIEKERSNERTAHSTIVDRMVTEFRAECKEIRHQYQQELQRQREECERHFALILSQVVDRLKEEFDREHERDMERQRGSDHGTRRKPPYTVD